MLKNPREGPHSGLSNLRLGTLTLVTIMLVLLGYWAITSLIPKPPSKPDAIWTRMLLNGVFRIGIDPSFPPFEMDDGKGNLSGLDVELADEIVGDWSRTWGTPIRVQYVYTGFDGLYDALQSGQFDAIISALPYDPKRTQDVRYTHSYFNGGPLVVVQEGDGTVKSWPDLTSKRVGVELGSSGDSFARKWERRLKYDVYEFNTPAEALHALRTGLLDSVFTDAMAVDSFLRTEGGIKMIGKPLSDELFVIAVSKDAPTLLQQINGVIDAMKMDGRMQRLEEEWF